jgi:hypothetical protein
MVDFLITVTVTSVTEEHAITIVGEAWETEQKQCGLYVTGKLLYSNICWTIYLIQKEWKYRHEMNRPIVGPGNYRTKTLKWVNDMKLLCSNQKTTACYLLHGDQLIIL